MPYTDLKEAADAFVGRYAALKEELSKVIIGQTQAVDLLITAIFCQGHALLVGVPGLAKTKLVQTLTQVLDLSFSRIQFTPDLMPSDILGTEVMNQERAFTFLSGPIFAQMILADEINRTPPKTQAALLEAMQEQVVTIGGKSYPMESPFFVFATQNPIEQEGTYPLPEAQLDRFMFEIRLDYPNRNEELTIVRNTTTAHDTQVRKVMGQADILEFQQLILQVPVTDNVLSYAVDLVRKTRPDGSDSLATQFLQWGAGPRASQYLILGAKCHALMQGKYAPDIENVQAIAPSVLGHRIVRNFKATAEQKTEQDIIQALL